MRLLVAGGAGFLGSHVLDRAASEGIEVAALVRSGSDRWRIPGAEAVVAEATDLDELTHAVHQYRPTHVVNAMVGSGHFATGPHRVQGWDQTVRSTVCLLEAMRRLGVERFVHVCSALVYAESDRPHRESDAVLPSVARGAAKAAAAHAVHQWSGETGIDTVVVRPFSLYGPKEAGGRVVPELLCALQNRSPFRFTRTESRRDFVFAGDVASGILEALDNPVAPGRVFNFGTGIDHSIRELASIAEAVTGRTLIVSDTVHDPSPADRSRWRSDPTAAQVALGWKAIDVGQGLLRTWEAMSE